MVLIGKIPRDVGNLTFLISLDLSGNNLHGNLPQEMARLRRLKFLDLSFNNFRGEIPSWLGQNYSTDTKSYIVEQLRLCRKHKTICRNSLRQNVEHVAGNKSCSKPHIHILIALSVS
ncbi:hypothetical protein MTR67_011233 [Solanum verrucosum]|uniref:Uncharacterized protein n=1 Tax=Solanum verrucosum TaxID=315347 RepID=A0AAF0Q7L1_SOLVR|nr:hypothetical protein MTR67_011233 [Solanum verrucosum]